MAIEERVNFILNLNTKDINKGKLFKSFTNLNRLTYFKLIQENISKSSTRL